MVRLGMWLAILVGLAAAATAILRHRAPSMGRRVPDGILITRPGTYDALTRVLLGSLFRGIARDVAAAAPADAEVLDLGCGPGHLSILLAREGLRVTGVDLDPAMIEHARANAGATEADRLAFLVGSATALPFADASFDIVVSTFSVHHWADPAAGIAEIGRVLRPGGRALIWDFKPGGGPRFVGPRHEHVPDPAGFVHGGPLRPVAATPWRWPLGFELAQRMELARADDQPGAENRLR